MVSNDELSLQHVPAIPVVNWSEVISLNLTAHPKSHNLITYFSYWHQIGFKSIFAVLISRWIILFSCKFETAFKSEVVKSATTNSGISPFSRLKVSLKRWEKNYQLIRLKNSIFRGIPSDELLPQYSIVNQITFF